MRAAIVVTALLCVACRGTQSAASTRAQSDSTDDGPASDSALLTPRVVTEPTVLVFWLAAADTFTADDQAEALDELNYSTEQIAPTLARHHIVLVPTNSDTIYVALPNRQRRAILLTGVDYPFGYVLVQPGTTERILAGIYDEDELQDELEAYFDLPSADSGSAGRPRVST